MAIRASLDARKEWSAWPFEDRAAVLLKAAELSPRNWRATVNAATMLGQAKTVFQSEIDAACELIDFWRFNVGYARGALPRAADQRPRRLEPARYRPLEGFVYAVSPFNFTAIGGNLSTAPVLMGGVSIWKPASSAMLSAYHVFKVLEAAGMPPGVINFLPGSAGMITDGLLGVARPGGHSLHRQHGGLPEHVEDRRRRTSRATRPTRASSAKRAARTSSSRTRRRMRQALAVAIVRGGFEYQGQKCSAASRIYVPQSLWKDVRDRAVAMMKDIKMGDMRDFRNFMSAVIDKKAFDKIIVVRRRSRRRARRSCTGGGCDDRKGYFIEPTLVQTNNPDYKLLCEEIFGPVVTVYVYPDDEVEGHARDRSTRRRRTR